MKLSAFTLISLVDWSVGLKCYDQNTDIWENQFDPEMFITKRKYGPRKIL